MKIDPDFRYRSGSRFFTQKSPRGSKSLHKASQSETKIDEKSNPETDFRYFGETLIFYDSTMVLVDFSGPDELKNYENSMKKSILQRYVPKSLQNRRHARFFRKIFENLLQKRPPKAP